MQRAVIEYDASAAQALTNRARTTLIVGSAGAVVLLMVAGVFWQLSRRAELAAGELERDQRLKMLGEMSAVLGHELKNPLASLKGHAQLLLEGIPPGHAARDGAETVVREAVRLEDLAQQVLDFARTGSVERDAEADPVALARAAAEDIGEEQVEVTVLGDPSTWPLDRVRMEQALMNLLRNARQASPEGKKVDLTVAFEEGKRVVYQVRDRGPGLNPGDESQVFEPFYTTRSRGAGLGLVVARRIVQEHGGTLEAQNHPEGGALFRVVIPREIPSGKSRA
jgi:two-component system sensor histidine kinase HydH